MRAYAHGLRLWFEFLGARRLVWDSVGVEDVSRFVAWLRAPADNVVVFDDTAAVRSAATVNRHLAALFGFYDFHARSGGVGVAAELVAWRRVSRGSYKPFLHGIASSGPVRTRPVGLRVPRRLPVVLDAEEVAVVLAACTRLRDRFLFALLAETGMRVGQALSLRHGDFVSRRRQVRIVGRADNANGARAKCSAPATVPVSASLVRLYSDYMHTEYGELDSDYVFVNLWSAPVGRPLRYDTVAKLVRRLRARTGIEFTPHTLRHSRATELIRAGVPIGLIRYACRSLSDLGGIDIEAEYASDIWVASRLGIKVARSPAQTRFDNIEQPWLRAAVKRWARLRLGSGKTFGSVHVDVRAMLWFSRFLTRRDPRAVDEAIVTRDALEPYLVWVTASHLAPHTSSTHITCLRVFLVACRRRGWLPRLPATAAIYHDDLPSRPRPLPRFIPEFAMAQLEDPERLAMLPDATTRALVIVITETGLRANDACSLPFTPIIEDSAGWPCLRYFNTKMAAEQLVPLSATAAEAIRAQQRGVIDLA